MAALRVAPPSDGLHGTLAVPGDKSIAHRALLLGAFAEGTTTLRGFSGGADVRSSLGAIAALGGLRVDYPQDMLRKPKAWLNHLTALNPQLGARPIR